MTAHSTEQQTIAVIGTGLIGASWAACFLARGHHVIATDPSETAEPRLRQQIAESWPALEQLGLSANAAQSNLTFTATVADAVRTATFIQESGPERLPLKHSIIAEIEAAAPRTTIIASSTSGLLISEMQSGAQHPERIVIGHPFNPPHLIPLVEVVGGKQTSPETITAALAFYTALGKKPIHITGEVPGHVANRLQVALWREAFSLVSRGIVSVADLDTAIAHGPGLRWALLGPFLNLHASGGSGGITHALEHLGPAMRDWANDLGAYPQTDDFITPLATGIAAELQDRNFAEILRQRDDLLVQLIAAKAAARQLP
jgi:3-hydroxyacyl-CoA dehydrogenase